MKVIKKSPVLRSVTRTGKPKFWQAMAFSEKGHFFIKKTWWQEGSKVQESTPVEVFGKNIGRMNETDPSDQALLELVSRVKKQRDKGYSEDGSSDHIPTKPMLAHKYKDKKDKIVYPCFVQPKLDGFRMLKEADGSEAWTRGGKAHTQECVKHLMWDTGRFMVDGELILPHMPPLQETSSAAKKFRPGVSDTLMYYIYDVVEPDLSFAERLVALQTLKLMAPKNVVLVTTIKVKNEDELMAAHAKFVSEGYEGTIIRFGEEGYNIGHRSNSLIKLKDFFDSEYEVIGVSDGKGSFKGKAIFECVAENGETFEATPEGSMEHRAKLYRTRKQHIGKWLTVRYPALSKRGVPVHAVGVDFREDGEF